MSTETTPSVYIETSVISYRTARPSRDLVVAAHQQITDVWWNDVLPKCEPFVSEVVLLEIDRGDAAAVARRLAVIESFSILRVVDGVEDLAQIYSAALKLPTAVEADAYHLALAALHGMDYIVSWNCRHIASGRVRRIVDRINADRGIESPTICTPEELLYA